MLIWAFWWFNRKYSDLLELGNVMRLKGRWSLESLWMGEEKGDKRDISLDGKENEMEWTSAYFKAI